MSNGDTREYTWGYNGVFAISASVVERILIRVFEDRVPKYFSRSISGSEEVDLFENYYIQIRNPRPTLLCDRVSGPELNLLRVSFEVDLVMNFEYETYSEYDTRIRHFEGAFTINLTFRKEEGNSSLFLDTEAFETGDISSIVRIRVYRDTIEPPEAEPMGTVIEMAFPNIFQERIYPQLEELSFEVDSRLISFMESPVERSLGSTTEHAQLDFDVLTLCYRDELTEIEYRCLIFAVYKTVRESGRLFVKPDFTRPEDIPYFLQEGTMFAIRLSEAVFNHYMEVEIEHMFWRGIPNRRVVHLSEEVNTENGITALPLGDSRWLVTSPPPRRSPADSEDDSSSPRLVPTDSDSDSGLGYHLRLRCYIHNLDSGYDDSFEYYAYPRNPIESDYILGGYVHPRLVYYDIEVTGNPGDRIHIHGRWMEQMKGSEKKAVIFEPDAELNNGSISIHGRLNYTKAINVQIRYNIRVMLSIDSRTGEADSEIRTDVDMSAFAWIIYGLVRTFFAPGELLSFGQYQRVPDPEKTIEDIIGPELSGYASDLIPESTFFSYTVAFLEDLAIERDGISFGGQLDAGRIRRSGREVIRNGTTHFYALTFDVLEEHRYIPPEQEAIRSGSSRNDEILREETPDGWRYTEAKLVVVPTSPGFTLFGLITTLRESIYRGERLRLRYLGDEPGLFEEIDIDYLIEAMRIREFGRPQDAIQYRSIESLNSMVFGVLTPWSSYAKIRIDKEETDEGLGFRYVTYERSPRHGIRLAGGWYKDVDIGERVRVGIHERSVLAGARIYTVDLRIDFNPSELRSCIMGEPIWNFEGGIDDSTPGVSFTSTDDTANLRVRTTDLPADIGEELSINIRVRVRDAFGRYHSARRRFDVAKLVLSDPLLPEDDQWQGPQWPGR